MTKTKRAVALALSALLALTLLAGPAAAQYTEIPSDLSEHYSAGSPVSGADAMAMIYDINDQLLGERWRTYGNQSWAINQCVTNTTRYPDFGTDADTRTEVCTAYQKGYLYPRSIYSGGVFQWDGVDYHLTRYDVAAIYYRWFLFYNAHNAPADSNDYRRVGYDAPGGGGRLHDLPYGAAPHTWLFFKDYQIDYGAGTIDNNTHLHTPDYEVTRGLDRGVHTGNRTLDPASEGYPWQYDPSRAIAFYDGPALAHGEFVASMLRRGYCAGQSFKNTIPSTFYAVETTCWDALWVDDNQGNDHRYVESPEGSGNWILDPAGSSYYRGYSFDRIGTDDFGWDGSGEFNNDHG